MPARRPVLPPRIGANVPAPKSGGIAWHFFNVITLGLLGLFNTFIPYLTDIYWHFMSSIGLWIMDDLLPFQNKVRNQILGDPNVPSSIKSIVNIKGNENNVFGLLIDGVLTIVAMIGGYLVLMERAIIEARQNAAKMKPNSLPDPNTLVAMLLRKVLTNGEYQSFMGLLGFNSKFIASYKELGEELLTPFDLIQLYNRKKIGVNTVINELSKRGFSQVSIDGILELGIYLAGPSDLVRFAVRDVFNSGIVGKYGYDEEFPQQFAVEAAKLGIPEETAKAYWRAHWQLPSPTQGYEMLHRKVIDKSTLAELLKISDYPKYWRDKLIDISYNPMTRVDIRRLYKDGVLTKQQVLEKYLDMGNSPENANLLTEWTIKEFIQEITELTKGEIIKSYTNGILDRNESINLLSQFITNAQERDLLLQNADIHKQDIYESEFVENVRLLFVSGRINEGDVLSRLSQLSMSSGFADDRLAIWKLQKERGIKRPTVTDIAKFYKKNIWSVNDVRNELTLQNYSDVYISTYLELWDSELGA